MENQTKGEQPHKRRVRYNGTHPRKYSEKYKELNPYKYRDTIEKVIAKGSTPAGMHLSICVQEILDFLQIKPGQKGLDATFGYGGHSEKMLQCLDGQGHLYALDIDPIEIVKSKNRLNDLGYGEDILTVIHENFANIDQVAEKYGPFDFLLADLGVSSMQIDGFKNLLTPPAHRAAGKFSDADGGQHRIHEEAVGAVIDHVLQHQHTQPVTGFVEGFRLHLDVLAKEVEAQLLHPQYVPVIFLRVFRQIDAVRKIALIQDTIEENGLPIEAKPLDAACIRLNADRAQGKIALHPILSGGHGQIVQGGAVRRPEAQVLLRNIQAAGALRGSPGDGGYFRPCQENLGGAPGGFGACLQSDACEVWGDFQALHSNLRNGLQPYRLPDAGHRSVPHTAPILSLLAVGIVVAQIVRGPEGEPVDSRLQKPFDAAVEGKVAALVVKCVHTVDEHPGDLIHSTEMEQYLIPLRSKVLRQGKFRLIYQGVAERAPEAAEPALRAEGQGDGAAIQRPSVQKGQEALPAELGAGITCFPSCHRHDLISLQVS